QSPQTWHDWFSYNSRLGATLKLCDAAVTTNEFLAARMRDFAGIPVAVVPNFMNREQLGLSDRIFAAKARQRPGQDGLIHLGYFSGSPSHNRDFAIVTPALEELLEEDERLGIVVVGYIDAGPRLERFGSRVKRFPFQDYVNLQRIVGSVEFSLVPLQFNSFTNCKSELKYFEAAAAGTISIASPTQVYAKAIRHGDNGYLARAHEWPAVLRQALGDLPRYRAMAERARDDALAGYAWFHQRGRILDALGLHGVASPVVANNSKPRIWACIVCYEPEPAYLRELVGLLESEVHQVVVVDNSPGMPSLTLTGLGRSLYLPMSSNAGTAAAMNEAWRLALAAGARFLVSFDQDSRPGQGLVQCLLAAFHAPSPSGRPVAAAGPVWNDRAGRPMRLLQPVGFRRRHVAAPAAGLVEVDHLISSGCLISAAAYREVGPFDERLFLDYVDIEWSLRARALGYATVVAAGCEMTHAIGERMLPVAGRQLAIHKPQRTYLQLRNHLLLWRFATIPRLWLLSDLRQLAGKVLGLLVLAPDRRERLLWICRGMVDGLLGKNGPPH